ncbi:YcaO-like family protein [Lysinibacillus xylanilyticus]|uniref:YcaO-like family protein n=1 Tax=Lysinibacillus xylanilyticus TaxID=582475 RepID=UPI0037FF0949
MKCIKIDKDRCVVIGADIPYEVECSDPDLFVELFNADVSNLDLSEGNKLNIEIIKKFKNDLQNDNEGNDTTDYIYINKERNLTKEEEVLYAQPGSIVYISNCSVNFILKNFSDIAESNHIYVIELFDDILITGVNQEKGTCLKCLLNRYLESRDEVLKIKNVKSLITNTQTNKELTCAAETLAKFKLTNADDTITIFNKNSKNIINTNLISMNGCHYCFEKNKSSFNNIKWLESNEASGKDYRTKELENAVSILKEYVTPIGPIYNLNEYEKKDFLNTNVYEVNSNASYEEVGYNLHGGKGYDKQTALISTIGEALERYNARRFETDSLIRGTFNELQQKYNILNPKNLILDKNTPNEYHSDKIYDWIMCKNLSTNQDMLVPAISIFFPFYTLDESELFLSQSSTGLASGFSISEAILSGLFEVIERDAYTIYHKNSMYYGNIATNVYSDEVAILINSLYNNGIEVILHYLKTDVAAHVVHCSLFDKKDRLPIYTHGSGCSLDINSAIKNAIIEACQLRISQIQLLNSEGDNESEDFKIYYEWAKGNIDYVNPFINQPNERTISAFEDYRQGSINENLTHLLASISELGYEVITADLGREDNLLSTVRVIIPGFQDIDDYGGRESKRLDEIPSLLNLSVKYNKNPMFS